MHCFFIHQAEVQPDFAKKCQCQPNAERRELALKSYAEVQPDLAKQCQCQPNAERRGLALKSYAEVQPDLAKQRYNTKTPNSKFFCRLISQPPSFSNLKICPQPLFTGALRSIFAPRKKVK